MRPRTAFAIHLSFALLDCDWAHDPMRNALMEDMPEWLDDDWAHALAAELLETTNTPYAPPQRKLAKSILASRAYFLAWKSQLAKVPLDVRTVRQPRMQTVSALAKLSIPAITNTQELAARFSLSSSELDWLSGHGPASRPSTLQKLQHYHYSWHPKPYGQFRLLEAPKKRLKAVQRQILRNILDNVPAHPASHGFTRGRSCLTGASVHASEAAVITLDLRDFFTSVPARRVHGVFRTLGYPFYVARSLTGLCTTRTPLTIRNMRQPHTQPRNLFRRLLDYIQFVEQEPVLQHEVAEQLAITHLPQGAPTSPALANLCAYRLDCRLSGLARSLDANYTRYADDMTFSGDIRLLRGSQSLIGLAEMIVREEGFAINKTKTRIMHKSQRQTVTGITVNRHINCARNEFDALKATLHNCVRHGPSSQNRLNHPDFQAHLKGRLAWFEQVNPARARKLRDTFEQIHWDR